MTPERIAERRAQVQAMVEELEELQEFLSIFKRKKPKQATSAEQFRKQALLRTQRGACPPGMERNRKSGQCVKQCVRGAVRNPDTGRCEIPVSFGSRGGR